MSRVGKLPIELPDGVQAQIAASLVSIQGPKGKLDYTLGRGIGVVKKDKALVVECENGHDKQACANWGTTRAILNNMVLGVTQGWKKDLELHGLGYQCSINGKTLKLNVGLSHDVIFEIPEGINAKVQKTTISLESANKQLVGNFARKLRQSRPPEPYLGKGVRIVGERIRRKAGKAGK